MDFTGQISKLIDFLSSGIKSFIDFIIGIPSLIYNLLDLIPSPFDVILITFMGILITVLIFKVVRLIVG